MKIRLKPSINEGFSLNQTKTGKGKKTDFKTILQSISRSSDPGFEKPLQELEAGLNSMLKAKVILPQQILRYQVQISELNLKVELASKAAESAVSLTRKIQSSQ